MAERYGEISEIPQTFDPDEDAAPFTRQVIDDYIKAGWDRVCPAPYGEKGPPKRGLTGYTGKPPSQDTIDDWLDEIASGRRLVPVQKNPYRVANIIIAHGVHTFNIDVDDYDFTKIEIDQDTKEERKIKGRKRGGDSMRFLIDKFGHWAENGGKPVESGGVRLWRLTARPQAGASGQMMLRLRPEWQNLRWMGKPRFEGQTMEGIETVHRRHRYSIAPPSLNRKAGDNVRFEFSDDGGKTWVAGTEASDSVGPLGIPPVDSLPLMSEDWAKFLSFGFDEAQDYLLSSLDDEELLAWLDSMHSPQGRMCARAQKKLDDYIGDMATDRHPTLNDGIWQLAHLGQEGHKGTHGAIDKLIEAFYDEAGLRDPGEVNRNFSGGLQKIYGECNGVIADECICDYDTDIMGSNKFQITINGRNEAELTDEILMSLAQATLNSDPASGHGGFLLGQESIVEIGNSHDGRRVIRQVNSKTFGTLLSRSIRFVKHYKDGSMSEAILPRERGEAALSHARKGVWLPVLKRVAYTPFFATSNPGDLSDIRLVIEPGYHKNIGIWADLSESLLSQVNDILGPEFIGGSGGSGGSGVGGGSGGPAALQARAVEARDWLFGELFHDFPFKDDASKHNCLAFTLLPFVRSAIDGATPIHSITAPAPQVGKGKLVKTAMGASFDTVGGHGDTSFQLVTPPTNEEEWRKFLLSKFRSGVGCLVLDNVAQGKPLESGSLASAVSEMRITDRVLGESNDDYVHSDTLWATTGNNLTMSDEIAKRSAPIALGMNEPHPELRTEFRHDIIERWVKENRPSIIARCIIIIQNWVNQGCPRGLPDDDDGQKSNIGKHTCKEWSQIMGGILGTIGCNQFLGNYLAFTESNNDEASQLSAFGALWLIDKNVNCEGATASELANLMDVDEIFDLNPSGRSRSIGRQLSKFVDRVFEIWEDEGGAKSGKYHITTFKSKGKTKYVLNRISRMPENDGK